MPKQFSGVFDEGLPSYDVITVSAENEFQASSKLADEFREKHGRLATTLRVMEMPSPRGSKDAVGYRVGTPEITKAADVIDFEVKQLGNTHIVEDAARALGTIPVVDATEEAVIAEVEKRFGPDAVALWLVRDPEYANERYGPGVVLKVTVPSDALVLSDLGEDGQLWVWPKAKAYSVETPATLKTQLERERVRLLSNVVHCLNNLESEVYIIIKPYREGLILYSQNDVVGWGYCFIPDRLFDEYEFNVNAPRFLRANTEALSRILTRFESEERVYFETDWNRVYFSTRDLTTRRFELKVEEVESDDSYYLTLKKIAESPVPHADTVYARLIESELSDAVRDLSNALGTGRYGFDEGGLKLNTGIRVSWGKPTWISTTLNVYGYSGTGEGAEATVLSAEHGPFRVVLDRAVIKLMNMCLSSMRRLFGKTLVMDVGRWQDTLMLSMEEILTLALAFNTKAWPDVFEWEPPTPLNVQFAAKFEPEYDKFIKVISHAQNDKLITDVEMNAMRDRVRDQATALLKQVEEKTISVDDAHTQIKQVMDTETAKFKPPTAAPAPTPTPAIKVVSIGSDMVNDQWIREGWKPITEIPRLEMALKQPGTGGASTPEIALEQAMRQYSPEKYEYQVVSHYALDYRFPYTVFVREKGIPIQAVPVYELKAYWGTSPRGITALWNELYENGKLKIRGHLEMRAAPRLELMSEIAEKLRGTIEEAGLGPLALVKEREDLINKLLANLPADLIPVIPKISMEEFNRRYDELLDKWNAFNVQLLTPGLTGEIHYANPEREKELVVRFTADFIREVGKDDVEKQKENSFHTYEDAYARRPEYGETYLGHLDDSAHVLSRNIADKAFRLLVDEAKGTKVVAPMPSVKTYAQLLDEFKGVDWVDALARFVTNYNGLKRDYLVEDLNSYLRTLKDRLTSEDLQRFYRVYPGLATNFVSIASLINWIPPPPTPTPAPAAAPAAKELSKADVARLEDVFRATLMRELGHMPRDVMSEFRIELDTVKALSFEEASRVIERLATEIVEREKERTAVVRATRPRVVVVREREPAVTPLAPPAVPPVKVEPPAVPLDLMVFPRRISSAESKAFYDAYVYAMYELGIDPSVYIDRFDSFRDAWHSNWFSVLRAFEGMVNDIKTGKAPRYYPRPPIWHELPRDAILHLLATKVYHTMDQLIAGLNMHGVYVEPDEVRNIVKAEWAKTPRDSWLEITPKEYLSETLGIPIEELPD